jgi:hypothetical protein
MQVVVLTEGNKTKVIRMSGTPGDSLVKEIIIDENNPHMFFSEDSLSNAGAKKMVWVTEDAEEGNEGVTSKKITIKTNNNGEDEDVQEYSFTTEGGGTFVLTSNGENGVQVTKEVRVVKEKNKKSEKTFNFMMKFNNGQNEVSLKTLSDEKLKDCKIKSTEDFNPENLNMKSNGTDLNFDLSFTSKVKGNISVALYNEEGNAISTEQLKKANKYDGTFKLPGEGKYYLLLSQDKTSRLFEVKVR